MSLKRAFLPKLRNKGEEKGEGREGKGREGKGREGKGSPLEKNKSGFSTFYLSRALYKVYRLSSHPQPKREKENPPGRSG